MTDFIAQALSLGSSVAMFASTRAKQTHRLYYLQVLNALLSAASYVLLGAWTGAATNLVAAGRNVFAAKGKLTPAITVTIVALQVVAGLWVNDRGWLGVLPILATTSYSAVMLKGQNNLRLTQWALVTNLFLWGIYGLFVGAWVAAATKALMMGSTLLSIMRTPKKTD